jgi:hypothetical protein
MAVIICPYRHASRRDHPGIGDHGDLGQVVGGPERFDVRQHGLGLGLVARERRANPSRSEAFAQVNALHVPSAPNREPSQVFGAELLAQVVGGLTELLGTPLRRDGHSDTGNAVTA